MGFMNAFKISKLVDDCRDGPRTTANESWWLGSTRWNGSNRSWWLPRTAQLERQVTHRFFCSDIMFSYSHFQFRINYFAELSKIDSQPRNKYSFVYLALVSNIGNRTKKQNRLLIGFVVCCGLMIHTCF